MNRRIILAERPIGVPRPQQFTRDDQPIPELGAEQFLVRNIFLSVDPAQRGWVNADSNYSEPVAIGAVMRSLAVGVVEQSRHAAFAHGEYLYGWFGWQDFCVATEGQVLRRVDRNQAPLSAAAGLLGISGLTAYLALTELGHPQQGETVVVSTAAGAVGSVAGQIARRLGCHVVGLTGTAEKVALCKSEFGYHEALDYKRDCDLAALGAVCPHGIDVFLDNTSGPIADMVVQLMNIGGRIIQCGTAAVAVWHPPPSGPRRDREILVRRLRQEGFIVFDHVAKFPAVAQRLTQWLNDGSLVFHEDIEDGLDRAPFALAQLYTGQNHGKKLIRL